AQGKDLRVPRSFSGRSEKHSLLPCVEKECTSGTNAGSDILISPDPQRSTSSVMGLTKFPPQWRNRLARWSLSTAASSQPRLRKSMRRSCSTLPGTALAAAQFTSRQADGKRSRMLLSWRGNIRLKLGNLRAIELYGACQTIMR